MAAGKGDGMSSRVCTVLSMIAEPARGMSIRAPRLTGSAHSLRKPSLTTGNIHSERAKHEDTKTRSHEEET